MKSIIEGIILDSKNNIKVENCFDSHLIIELLIEDFSDEYFKFVCQYSHNQNDIAKIAHSQISKEIQKLSVGDDAILEQMPCKSVSFNIHKNISDCALWKRIK